VFFQEAKCNGRPSASSPFFFPLLKPDEPFSRGALDCTWRSSFFSQSKMTFPLSRRAFFSGNLASSRAPSQKLSSPSSHGKIFGDSPLFPRPPPTPPPLRPETPPLHHRGGRSSNPTRVRPPGMLRKIPPLLHLLNHPIPFEDLAIVLFEQGFPHPN